MGLCVGFAMYFGCACAHSTLTRELHFALNARGSLFYFYCLFLESLLRSRRVLYSGEMFTFGLRSGPYANWADPIPSPGDL